MEKEKIINQIIVLTERLKQIVETTDEKDDVTELNQLAYYFANAHCNIKEILKMKYEYDSVNQ